MSIRRRAKVKPVAPDLLAGATALCVQSYRPQAISRQVQQGERRQLDDALVRKHPEMWVLALPMVDVLAAEARLEGGEWVAS